MFYLQDIKDKRLYFKGITTDEKEYAIFTAQKINAKECTEEEALIWAERYQLKIIKI